MDIQNYGPADARGVELVMEIHKPLLAGLPVVESIPDGCTYEGSVIHCVAGTIDGSGGGSASWLFRIVPEPFPLGGYHLAFDAQVSTNSPEEALADNTESLSVPISR